MDFGFPGSGFSISLVSRIYILSNPLRVACNQSSAIASHVTSSGDNMKRDHFEILARGRSGMHPLQDKGDPVD